MDDTESSSHPYGSQAFNVDYTNWHTSISITDPTGQPLYMLSKGEHRGEYIITDTHTQTIGVSKISEWTDKITITLPSTSSTFEIRNNKALGMGSPSYVSPAFNNQKVTCENKARSSNIIYTFVDEQGIAHARFESNAKTRIGKLEIVDAVAGEEQKVVEIVVVFLTLLKRKLKSIETSTIVAVT